MASRVTVPVKSKYKKTQSPDWVIALLPVVCLDFLEIQDVRHRLKPVTGIIVVNHLLETGFSRCQL